MPHVITAAPQDGDKRKLRYDNRNELTAGTLKMFMMHTENAEDKTFIQKLI